MKSDIVADGQKAAITFNDLLLKAGIPTARAKLVRHQDGRARGSSLYEIWRTELEKFEAYQAIQSLRRFDIGDVVASFVVTPPPSGDTLLAGLYIVKSVALAPPRTVDPLDNHDVTGLNQYQFARDDRLRDYVGRLTVVWGGGYRTWCQLAHRHDKLIKEIRDEVEEQFPGFDQFSIALQDLPRIYPTWKQILRNFTGVYVLADRDSGQLYVGSATGEDRLWGRLLEYADGHGGNVALRNGDRRRLQFSVLQVASTEVEAHRLEIAWKQKLLSRERGLNRN